MDGPRSSHAVSDRNPPSILPQCAENPLVAFAVLRRSSGGQSLWEEDGTKVIAQIAYYRAMRRGFAPGGELEDWLIAEREVSRALERS
jgi:hypothetical protein